jgi:hypothetical protein
MPRYDAANYDPPAPVAEVTLRDTDSGESLSGVPMLIDTGADITLLSIAAVTRLGVKPIPGYLREMESFDGTRSSAPGVFLDLIFLGRIYRGKYVLIDSDHGILGRDILAHVALRLDGPGSEWSHAS